MSYFRTTSVEINNTNPLLFAYGDGTNPVPVEITGGEIGTTVQIANTSPIPVSLSNQNSIVQVSNFSGLAYSTGTVSSLTQRIVLATPTQDVTGTLISTPYNAVVFSTGAAATYTNRVEIDVRALNPKADICLCEISATTNTTVPGANSLITLKLFATSYTGLTSGSFDSNNPWHTQFCYVKNVISNQNISVSTFPIPPLRYWVLYLDNTVVPSGAIIEVTVKLTVGYQLDLYS